MSYNMNTLPDDQIVLTTFQDGLPTSEELISFDKALHKILETFDSNKKIFAILDLRGLWLSLEEIAQAFAETTQFNDAWYKNLKILVVGDGYKANLVAESFQQEQYGNHPSAFFTSVEDALAYARQ